MSKFKDIKVGDLIKLGSYGPDKVRAVIGDGVVVLADAQSGGGTFTRTIEQLEEWGYEYYDDTKVELTLDEVADKFGIDVDKLRIKE